MNIIFLDVDGVIKPNNTSTPLFGMNDVCMANLKRILDETDAKIVLSTSWRENKNDHAFLLDQLQKGGIDKELVIDSTPILWHLDKDTWDDSLDKATGGDGFTGKRGHEIWMFLRATRLPIHRFVVLDDDETPSLIDWSVWQHGKFIQTKMEVGLDEELTKQAIDFLKG